MVPLQPGTWMIGNWRFKQDRTRPELIRQSQVQTNAPAQSIDPFELRKEFWSVKSEREMLDLLNRTGIKWGTEGAFFVADVFKFREFAQQAVVKPITRWQRIGKETAPKGRIAGGSVWYVDAITSLSGILCQPSKGGVCFHATYSDFKQVILAATLIDKLEQNHYAFCRKPNCRMPFKIDIRNKKQYCSEAHRQAEAMRRVRLRQKAKKR